MHYIRPFGRRKILFIREAIEWGMDAYLAFGVSGALDEPGVQTRRAASAQARQKGGDAASVARGPVPMAAGGVYHV